MIRSIDLGIPQYEAKRYPANRLDKVQDLFCMAYGGRTVSLEGLRWRMEKNPCLQNRATSLWHGEDLVAYMAMTPQPAILNGKEILSACNGTVMADRRFPGASLQLYIECARQNEDIDLIYGYPNKNSFGIITKYLKQHYVGDVAFWSAKPEKKKASDMIHEFRTFTDEYEYISRNLSKSHEFIKIRGKDFQNWRFFDKPDSEYRGFEYGKRGYIVVDTYTENGMRQLQIVDILADSKEVMDQLLKYAHDLAWESGCDLLKLWLTSKEYEDVLTQNGFSYGEHPFKMTVWDQDIDLSRSYLTMADSDVF